MTLCAPSAHCPYYIAALPDLSTSAHEHSHGTSAALRPRVAYNNYRTLPSRRAKSQPQAESRPERRRAVSPLV